MKKIKQLKNKSWVTIFSLAIIITLVVVAVLAPALAPFEPQQSIEGAIQIPPSWSESGNLIHIFGTDDLGRDIFSRIVWGSRVTLLSGLYVVIMSTLAGVFLGLITGYIGGTFDQVTMRFIDIIMSLPSILFAIVVVTIMGQGLFNTVLAISIVSIPAFVRIVRGAVINELKKNYVIALQVMGASHFKILFENILPNCSGPILVQATLTFSDGILNTAALGALGLGVQPPTPEWGTMLADSRSFMDSAPWLVTLPGVFILIAVLAFNLIGDSLRDHLDPKLRKMV